MRAYFEEVASIQGDLVAGALEDAKRHAKELAERMPNEKHPVGWDPRIHLVRDALRGIAKSNDLAAASGQFGRVGQACGRCHDDLGVAIEHENEFFVIEHEESLAETMQHHLSATQALWFGVVAPSNEHWQDGAEQLLSVRLLPDQVPPTTELKELEDRVHRLGERALQTAQAPQRAALFGELLSTCARCHAALP